MKHGPNVKKLIARKMALIMIPPGTPGDGALAAGLSALSTAERISAACKEATAWVEQSLVTVREMLSDSNQFRGDEAIAAEILRQIDEREGT